MQSVDDISEIETSLMTRNLNSFKPFSLPKKRYQRKAGLKKITTSKMFILNNSLEIAETVYFSLKKHYFITII